MKVFITTCDTEYDGTEVLIAPFESVKADVAIGLPVCREGKGVRSCSFWGGADVYDAAILEHEVFDGVEGVNADCKEVDKPFLMEIDDKTIEEFDAHHLVRTECDQTLVWSDAVWFAYIHKHGEKTYEALGPSYADFPELIAEGVPATPE